MLTRAVTPDYPDSARDLGLGPALVPVVVTVDEKGTVVAASLFKTSGNSALDRAAILAARQSTYAPQLVNCAPTTGTYMFNAHLDPDERAQGILQLPLPQNEGAASCPNPNREAWVVKQAVPDPDLARREDVYSMVLVEVRVGANADVLSATIYKSSGNVVVDRAAIASARQSTYEPKLVNCVPVAGDYLFRILFKPN